MQGNYRYHLISAAVLAAAVLLLSCQKEQNPQWDNSQKSLRISAQACSSETKASVVEDNEDLSSGETFRWDATDKFILFQNDPTTPGNVSPKDFTIDPNSIQGSKADFIGKLAVGTENDKIYALYPYSNPDGVTTIPITGGWAISLSSSQEQQGTTSTHLKDNMLMYASAALLEDIPASTSSSTVNLPNISFHHLTSLVRFRVRNTTDIPWQITGITLRHSDDQDNTYWFTTAGQMDFETEAISSPSLSRQMSLSVSGCSPLTQNTTGYSAGNYFNGYMSLLPTPAYSEEYSGSDYLSILVSLHDGSATNPQSDVTLEYKAPYKDVTFLREGLKAGMRYYFNLVIDNQLKLDGIGISGWDEGISDSGNTSSITLSDPTSPAAGLFVLYDNADDPDNVFNAKLSAENGWCVNHNWKSRDSEPVIAIYSPYSASQNTSSITIDIQTASIDYCVARISGQKVSDLLDQNGKISFTQAQYKHIMGKVKVVAPEGTTDIVLKGIRTYSTYMLLTGNMNNQIHSSYINDYTMPTPSAGISTCFITPQTISSGTPAIELTVSGKKYFYIPSSTVVIAEGRETTITLSIPSPSGAPLTKSECEPYLDATISQNIY